MRAVAVCSFSLLAFWACSGVCQEITSFVRRPEGIAPTNTIFQFQCVGGGGIVSWLVGSTRFNSSSNAPTGYSLQTVTTGSQTNSTLELRAKEGENDTQVACLITSPSRTVTMSTIIIIATPPLPPSLTVALLTDGSALEAEWRRPFTHEGFPITSYALTVTNKTTGAIADKVIVETDLDRDVLLYDLSNPMVSYTICHSLVFSVVAANSIGTSTTSDSVIAGFPIFPTTDNVILFVTATTTSDNDTELISSFQTPGVCVYQDPASYIINVYNTSRTLVRTTGMEDISSSEPTLIQCSVVLQGLLHGNTLSAELIITHPHVTGNAYFTYLGIDLPFDEDVSIGGLGGAPPTCCPTTLIVLLTLGTLYLHHCVTITTLH